MRTGLWDRQGTNTANRQKVMTEMYVSFSVKSSDFGYKLTHFRRDFVKSGVTTLARGNCKSCFNVCFNYFVRGFRGRERERFMCVYICYDRWVFSLVGICYLIEYLLPQQIRRMGICYSRQVFATAANTYLRFLLQN